MDLQNVYIEEKITNIVEKQHLVCGKMVADSVGICYTGEKCVQAAGEGC